MAKTYTIRTARIEEMKYPVSWAGAEGWNPGLFDADTFYYSDPKGFFLGFLDNEPIGCISAVSYGDFGFVGFYILKPEHRGQGYGIKLWQRAMDYLSGKNVGLDGVVAQQENYKKSGFTLAYRNIRYQGKGTGGKHNGKNIVDLATVPFNKVESYDQGMFPAIRSEFLKRWLKQPKSQGLALVEKGNLKGYGVIRPCQEGYKIGPLFADTKTGAANILDSLLSYAPKGKNVYFDVPEPNKAAVSLAEKHHMTKVFETARMYTKGLPKIDLTRIFGITTFELG